MKELLFVFLLMLPISVVLTSYTSESQSKIIQPVLGVRSAKIIEAGGLKFKDLNKNEKLDRYEDWRLSPDERSKDLL